MIPIGLKSDHIEIEIHYGSSPCIGGAYAKIRSY